MNRWYEIVTAAVTAIAVAPAASAQAADRFDGIWTVTWEGKSAIFEARLEIQQDKGSWRTLARNKNDPCVGKEAPIHVDTRTADSLQITLQFSEAVPGCKDAKVRLSAAPDGTVTGTRGNADLKLVRPN